MIQLRYKNLLIDQLENGLPEAVATIVESIGDLYCMEKLIFIYDIYHSVIKKKTNCLKNQKRS